MRTNFILLLVAGTAVLCTIAKPVVALDGEWQPVKNVDAPHVQKLGKWAVVERMKVSNCGLRFNKVVGAEVKIMDGKNYRLQIDALRLDGKHAVYKAEVLEHDDFDSYTRKLVSFDSCK